MVGARRSLIPDIKPKDNRNMMKIKISLVIILIISCLSLGVGLVLGEDSSETDYRVVKVLVYSGTDTSDISIEQVKSVWTSLTWRT